MTVFSNTLRLADTILGELSSPDFQDPSVTYLKEQEAETTVLTEMYKWLVAERKDDLKDRDMQLREAKENAYESNIGPQVGPTATPVSKDSNAGFNYLLAGLGLLAVGGGLYVFRDEIKAVWDQLVEALDIQSITETVSSALNKAIDVEYFKSRLESLFKGDTGAQYNGSDIGYDADAAGARKSVEEYLGRAVSDKEFDELIRATHAESGAKTNVKEEGLVLGTILNRARSIGGEESITKALTAKNQFQSVTGTSAAPGPSKQYVEGAQGQRKESIFYAAKNVLPAVSRNQTKFTAASSGAYKAGTNIGYRDELISKGGTTVGGTVFNTSLGALPSGLYTPGGGPTDLKFAPGVDQNIQPAIAGKVSMIQNAVGKSLTITSGYRSPERNKEVGGAASSAHLRGNAVDVSGNGMSPGDKINLIKTASAAGIGGIGVYTDGSMHFDTEGRRGWGDNYSYSSVPTWAKPTIDAHLKNEFAGQLGNITSIETTAVQGATPGQTIPAQVPKPKPQTSVVFVNQKTNNIAHITNEEPIGGALPLTTNVSAGYNH